MKAKIILLLLFVLLLPSVYAQVDCSARGNIQLTLDKTTYLPGDTITGTVSIDNKNSADSPVTYTFKIYKGQNSPYALTEYRTVPAGQSKYTLSQIFHAGVPPTAETGRWALQFTGTMDNCIWGIQPNEIKVFYVVSCSDGVLNGDETGIDCGGKCKQQCTTTSQPATTTSIQAAGASIIQNILPTSLSKKFFLYLAIIILLLMIIIGSSIIYWRRRARFSKFY